MPYLKKLKIKGHDYFYLFHTVREGDKFKKISKYIGKEEPSKEELENLKNKFLKKIKKTETIEKKPSILNDLKEIQKKHNHLPEKDIIELSKKTNIPLVEIYSTATFYSLLSIKKKGKPVVRICNSPSCYLNGSLNILKEAKKIAANKKFTLELTSCIGCCDKAPAIMINDNLITNLTKENLRGLLK